MGPKNKYGLTKRELIQLLAGAPDDAVVELTVSKAALDTAEYDKGSGVYTLTLPGDGSVGPNGVCLMAWCETSI